MAWLNDQVLNYLQQQYQVALAGHDFELAAWYWNGARTVELARLFKEVR